MGWRVWGDDFTTADMTGVTKAQAFVTNKNVVLRAVRTWFIVINDPVFTSINALIYSNDVVASANTPRDLIATSTDNRTKAELHSLAHGVKETYFTFDDVPLQENTTYNLVINAAGYTATDSSYLAWRKAFPDPVYPSDYTLAFETIGQSPYEIYLIAGEI